MRNTVFFRHAASYIRVSDEEDIVPAKGALWFRDLLKRIPDLNVDEELCEEDWGVVVFVERSRKKFWIGLSFGLEEPEGSWFAHIHHGSFAWLERVSSGGRMELVRLARDIHAMLCADSAVSGIRWFKEGDMRLPDPPSSPEPEGS